MRVIFTGYCGLMGVCGGNNTFVRRVCKRGASERLTTGRELVTITTNERGTSLILGGTGCLGIFSGRFLYNSVTITGKLVTNIKGCSNGARVSIDKGLILPNFVSTRVRLRDSVIAPTRFTGTIITRNAAAIVASPRRVAGMVNVSKIRCVVRTSRGLPVSIRFVVPSYIPTARVSRDNTRLSYGSVSLCLSGGGMLKLTRVVGCINIVGDSGGILSGVIASRTRRGGVSNRTPRLSNGSLGTCVTTNICSSRRYSAFRGTLRGLEGNRFVVVERNATTRGLGTLVPLLARRCCSEYVFTASSGRPDSLLCNNRVSCVMGRTLGGNTSPVITLGATARRTTECFLLGGGNTVTSNCLTSVIIISGLRSFGIRAIFGHNGLIFSNRIGSFSTPAISRGLTRGYFSAFRLGDMAPDDFGISKGLKLVNLINNRLLAHGLNATSGVSIRGSVLGVTYVRHRGNAGRVNINCIGNCSLGSNTITASITRSSRGVVAINYGSSSVTITIGTVGSDGNNVTIIRGNGVGTLLRLPVTNLVSSRPLAAMGRGLRGTGLSTCRLNTSGDVSPFVALSFLDLPIVPDLEVAAGNIFSTRG